MLNQKTWGKVEVDRQCERIPKNTLLFREGANASGVYAINKGKVKVFRPGHDGKEQIVHLAGAGDLLGYRTLISGELFPVGGRTLEHSEVCFIPAAEFLHLLDEDPRLQRKLLQQACKELGHMTGLITNLAQKNTRQRLLITFLALKELYADSLDENGKVVINLSREDLAGIVGTSTENLIRTLSTFKRDGLIETAGRKIVLVKPLTIQGLANAV